MCNSSLDCSDCENEHYCTDGICSEYCSSVKVGDNCTFDDECNPQCANTFFGIFSKKLCIDKKCSLNDKSPSNESYNYTVSYWCVGAFLVISLIYGVFECLSSSVKRDDVNPA